MSPEIDNFMYSSHGENMTQQSDLLRDCERFFVPATMEDYVFCGDERGSEWEAYLSLFGGIVNISYNLELLKEAAELGSVTAPFEQTAASQTPIIMHRGGLPNAGVHSDSHAEGEHARDIDSTKTEGKIGCGYAELRGPISASIAKRAEEILEIARQKRPELFAGAEADSMARAIIAAHSRIADREGVLPAGREMILAAKDAGAKSMVVYGDHVAKKGIINLQKNTKMDTSAALAANTPTYVHDQWVALEVFDNLHSLYPYDKRLFDMSETIDAIGTMLALGVEEIEVRR